MYMMDGRIMRHFKLALMPTISLLSFVYITVIATPQIVKADTLPGDMVQSVSVGDGTTCAVRNYKAYCWGQDVTYGYSGYTTKNSPQLITSSDISTKTVTKVSVGVNHACLLASARVYCWGANNSGQLGDGTTSDRSSPTPVNTSGALKSTEIMDIATGDGFSCALATNGVISCWGNRANGRIGAGNGKTGVEAYPKAVDTTGALAKKRAIRLARASNATMCAIAIDASKNNASVGDVYCWGFGINNGSSAPSELNGSSTACLDAPPKPYDTYFSTDRPVLIPGAAATSVDGQLGDVTSDSTPITGYMSAVTSNTSVRYWGRSGYGVTYSQGTTCSTPVPPSSPPPPPPSSPPPPPPPSPKGCTNAYWALNLSGTPVQFTTPTGGRTGGIRAEYNHQPNSRLATGISHSPKVMLARLNISTGSPEGPGDHNQQNSQGQNIGGGGNTNDTTQTVFHFPVYHLCVNSSGSVKYVECRTSGLLSLISPTGGEKAMVTATLVGTTASRSSATKVYEYSGLSSITCDPSLNPREPLAAMINLLSNIIVGKSTDPIPDKRSATNARLAVSSTKYTYIANVTPIGQTTATIPPTYPTNQTGVRLIAGTAYEGKNGGLLCVVTTSAGTYCDGHGNSTLQGQLGNNSFAQQTGQKLVYDTTKSQNIWDISTTGGYTCAVVGGYLECWGMNTSGQLGIGNTNDQSKPMRVTSWP